MISSTNLPENSWFRFIISAVSSRELPPYYSETQNDIHLILEDPGFELRGWPGYRTRPGCSGYDPVDYQAEYGHMLGRLVKMVIKGDYYSDEPFVLILFLLFGPVILFHLLSPFIFGFWPLLVKMKLGIFGNGVGLAVSLPVILTLTGFINFLRGRNKHVGEKENDLDSGLKSRSK